MKGAQERLEPLRSYENKEEAWRLGTSRNWLTKVIMFAHYGHRLIPHGRAMISAVWPSKPMLCRNSQLLRKGQINLRVTEAIKIRYWRNFTTNLGGWFDHRRWAPEPRLRGFTPRGTGQRKENHFYIIISHRISCVMPHAVRPNSHTWQSMVCQKP